MQEEIKKICSECSKEKSIVNFECYNKKYWAKKCRACKYQIWKQKDIEKARLVSNKATWTFRRTWGGKATMILCSMRDNSKRKGFPLEAIEWNKELILSKIVNGKCAISGVDFDLLNYSNNRCNPFAPSPDRIDNSKGYTLDNVQWVCHIINKMKGEHSMDVVNKLITSIKNLNK